MVFAILVAASIILLIFAFARSANYPTDKDVTSLFIALAASDDLIAAPDDSLGGDVYYVVVECALGRARFWVKNDPYAWASQGRFISAVDPSNSLAWDGVMPSRKAIKKMKRAIGGVGQKITKWKGENPPSHFAPRQPADGVASGG